MLHWDNTINLGTVIVGTPMLLMIAKMYGDWRIIKSRIDLMWVDYCKDHNINPKMMIDLRHD
jgi:hypothetical protein